jgi:hypothetical protein
MMCKDTEGEEDTQVTPNDWGNVMERIEDYHGAAHCYCIVEKLKVR